MGRSRSHSRSRERRRSRSPRRDERREERPGDRSRERRRDRSRSRDRRRSPDRRDGRPRSPRREERPRDRSWERRREGGGPPKDERPQERSREREQRAMPAPERRGPGPCFRCGEEGHMARDCPMAPPPGAPGGGRGPCYNCGQEGHVARDCPNPEVPGAGGPRGRRRREEGGDEGNMAWGRPGEGEEEEVPDKEVEPEFGLSGALAAETNKVNGVVLLHQEPPEARKPTGRWRLYVFKNGEVFGDPLHVHRMSSYLFGRERRVADVPTDHPSCSKQHAVLQFRQTEKEGADGMMKAAVRPYIMDLGSTNGTFLNGERIEAERYYELLEKDLLRFGNSTREYVLLKEQ